MNSRFFLLTLGFILCAFTACKNDQSLEANDFETPSFTWDNATVYFLLTDRFYDADTTNNFVHTPDNPPASFRGYMGGDIKGITHKVESGYFNDLGITAIWMTPLVEQIQGSVDEGTGRSFGFHGYWTRDWTALDTKFGTEMELKELVKAAHQKGIRILIDVVANHTGPVTALDQKWPEEWVKTSPRCTYQSAETTINCTLVENLPDIRTESKKEVNLPDFLIAKWQAEGRYDEEIEELNEWFATTGYPRTAINYILKWLVDFIKKFGVDGFRVDTVKHTEPEIWGDLRKAAEQAYQEYKNTHSDPVLDQDSEFYMVGEVYNYFVSNGREFDYGDKKVDFFKHGFNSLINFDFKSDAHKNYETIFSKYDQLLRGKLKGKNVLNYISSHDDSGPFDLDRRRPIEAGTKLLLCPGGVQVYYGDESARSLTVKADGDARLRSFMNWTEIEQDLIINGIGRKEILLHWQKLGTFRRDNPAIGAGKHKMRSSNPYIFMRTYTRGNERNQVIVGLEMKKGIKTISVSDVFKENEVIRDAYGQVLTSVKNGNIIVDTPYDIVLLERPN